MVDDQIDLLCDLYFAVHDVSATITRLCFAYIEFETMYIMITMN